ncbi:MAG: DUF4255 domain-containing protein [Planctomycetes bacterium]|nr:DUF4255 domain-containing protein [Planctomycetota bacterium]
MHEHQYRVMKHITLALGRTLEASAAEALGKKVRVAYEYSPDLKKAPGGFTVLHCGLARRGGNADREYERTSEGERFRNPPVLLRARYVVSCWAPSPDDQELLGVALRTFHDHAEVEVQGEEEATVAPYEGRPTIEMEALGFDEHKKVAEALGIPLAPSVAYWVDFVIQSGRTTPIKRVRERVMDFKKIDG